MVLLRRSDPYEEFSNIVRSQEVTIPANQAVRENNMWRYRVSNHKFTWEDPRGRNFRNFFNLSGGAGVQPRLILIADNKSFKPESIQSSRWGIKMEIKKRRRF